MSGFLSAVFKALTFSAGYNTAVVAIGAALLGIAAGAIGAYVLLRKRALISDAIAHATLPGVGAAFLLATMLGFEGRNLPILLLGASVSAALGVLCVQWITDKTRLNEDAAIGTVLSTFFALGIVLLTIIQSMRTGGQAGLEGFLLGSTAGMLANEAILIATAATLVAIIAFVFHRAFTLVAFDPHFTEVSGWSSRRTDLIMLGLLLATVVIGLKTVGLVLVIALTIIPPVTARLWTDRVAWMVLLSSFFGGIGSFIGTALSSAAPNLPTGGVIVLVLFTLLAISLVISPIGGFASAMLRHFLFQLCVHERQGLLALARREPIFDPFTRRVLTMRGMLRRDGVATQVGLSAARVMERDQALWNIFRDHYPNEAFVLDEWSLKSIENVLPADLVCELEQMLKERQQHGADR